MQTPTFLLTLSAWFLAGQLEAQTFTTNRITPGTAVRIASQFPVGMSQVEVNKTLEQNGFGKPTGVISPFSALIHNYRLVDNFVLQVQYFPKAYQTNDMASQVADSRLHLARILSNGVRYLSIPLTNHDAERTIKSAQRVAMTNLLANMREFRGKRVEVSGYYRSGREYASLHIDREDARNLRYDRVLSVMPFARPGYESYVRFIKEGNVRIVGIFDYNVQYPKLGVGHMNGWPAEIVRLELFEEIK